MILQPEQRTAKIYRFPTKGARACAGANDADKSGAERACATPYACDFGSGWYHEAAMREAEPAPRKP